MQPRGDIASSLDVMAGGAKLTEPRAGRSLGCARSSAELAQGAPGAVLHDGVDHLELAAQAGAIDLRNEGRAARLAIAERIEVRTVIGLEWPDAFKR